MKRKDFGGLICRRIIKTATSKGIGAWTYHGSFDAGDLNTAGNKIVLLDSANRCLVKYMVIIKSTNGYNYMIDIYEDLRNDDFIDEMMHGKYCTSYYGDGDSIIWALAEFLLDRRS